MHLGRIRHGAGGQAQISRFQKQVKLEYSLPETVLRNIENIARFWQI
jgi:hypothetical protein